MDNRMQILEDLDVLVRMCRSKSDGASIAIEEEEIQHKISELDLELEEIKNSADEENYDTSAEMADRNIEIITKKIINTIKTDLKTKTSELQKLKEKEIEASDNLTSLKANKKSHENYIANMQERIASVSDEEIINRYNTLINESEEKVTNIEEELKTITETYTKLQEDISNAAAEIEKLNTRLEAKQEQLLETQHNLENKETYIDQTKLERNNRKVEDINSRKEKLEARLEEISGDPKYLEVKIKNIINENGDMESAVAYLKTLISCAISQPYMNVAADNALEEELLRATQARDTFANEINQKNYNIMETESPEQIRIEYLNERIKYWNTDLETYENKIALVDKDEQFNYQQKDERIANLIASLKEDYEGFKKAYEDEPDANFSKKATLKVSLQEKKEDLANAEKIAAQFKNDEAEDIKLASNLIKNECEKIKNNIQEANEEIEEIKNRLMSKKSGVIDISAQNKDKDKLKELADVVVDIKHRRQFADQPEVIAKRLEQNLNVSLLTDDMINEAHESDSIDEVNNNLNMNIETEVANTEETPTEFTAPVVQTETPSEETTEITAEAPAEETVLPTEEPAPVVEPEVPTEAPAEVPVEETPVENNIPAEFNIETPAVEEQVATETEAPVEVTPEVPTEPTVEITTEPIAPIVEETPVIPTEVPTEEPVASIDQAAPIQEIVATPIENTVDTEQKNDNIVSSDIANELDQYINSLGSVQS